MSTSSSTISSISLFKEIYGLILKFYIIIYFIKLLFDLNSTTHFNLKTTLMIICFDLKTLNSFNF